MRIYELENQIMAKYGYTFNDLENDDWRSLFDLKRNQPAFKEAVRRYFNENNVIDFLFDLFEYDKWVDELSTDIKYIECMLGWENDPIEMLEADMESIGMIANIIRKQGVNHETV